MVVGCMFCKLIYLSTYLFHGRPSQLDESTHSPKSHQTHPLSLSLSHTYSLSFSPLSIEIQATVPPPPASLTLAPPPLRARAHAAPPVSPHTSPCAAGCSLPTRCRREATAIDQIQQIQAHRREFRQIQTAPLLPALRHRKGSPATVLLRRHQQGAADRRHAIVARSQPKGRHVATAARHPGRKRKRGSTETIGLYAVQCCECHKWRTIPTKEEFETLRENFTDDPWVCSKRPDCSCKDPGDIEYDSRRIWVIDKPNIPKPPPKTDRLVVMRGDLSKLDIYYVMPNGKRARCTGDVQKFLDANPDYKDRISVESFSFATPKIVEETVSRSSAWKAAKAKKQDKTNASSSKN